MKLAELNGLDPDLLFGNISGWSDVQKSNVTGAISNMVESVRQHIFNGISDRSDNSVIRKAIDEGKYEAAIQEGRMTQKDAIDIITAAGLTVPASIQNAKPSTQKETPVSKPLEDRLTNNETVTIGDVVTSLEQSESTKDQGLAKIYRALFQDDLDREISSKELESGQGEITTRFTPEGPRTGGTTIN